MGQAQPKEIKVPEMGESVTEATLARWLKKEGDPVKLDETLAELETDKVTLEVSAPAAGVLSKILIAQGGTVAVGDLIALLTPGEAGAAAPVASTTPPPVAAAPAAPTLAGTTAFPAAKKMMTEQNVAADAVPGTGKGGRITKGDVLQAIAQPAASMPSVGERLEERVPMTRLRQKIAERLKSAQNTAAILTTFNEIDMSRVMGLRDRLKEPFEKKHGVKLGFMSFFVRSCLLALKEIPAVNAEIRGNEIVYKNYYDIGVAVGTPQGLVVPILRNAHVLSFADIEKQIGALGLKARDGKLSIEDLTGGTFTISNGGVYGSLMSTPILNPPQSGILGMHKIQKRPIAVGNAVEIRPMMYIALSYDHRIIDGREAVTFLIRVKECLEDPERLMLEI
ncbi:MAG: 2-oxoglutarate dehydrogenase complex dihydrolipoyllysine-residue succinyltransferase [Alphaproteobacteria bacterium]